MPYAPLSLCVVTGCPVLVPRGRCPEHEAQGRREADKRRPNANARGYDHQWRQTQREYLAEHPQCECSECSTLPLWQRPAATDVDHIDGLGPKGPRGHDWGNLQALTHAHHSSKTARENGGFGRR